MKRTIKLVGKDPEKRIKHINIEVIVFTEDLTKVETEREITKIKNDLIDLLRVHFDYSNIK